MKNKIRLVSILIFVSISILSSCAKNEIPTKEPYSIIDVVVEYSTPTMEPFNFPKSEPNFATVKGRLIVTNISMLPSPDDGLFLVPLNPTDVISTIPTFQIGDVPQAVVDERNGDFVFTNIEIGKYALIVMTQGGAQIPASYKELNSYVIFDINENDLGKEYDLIGVTFP